MNTSLILNFYGDRTFWISRSKSIRFLFHGLDEEWILRKKRGYARRIADLYLERCCPHATTWRSTQTNNTLSSHRSCRVPCRWRWDFRIFIANCHKFIIFVTRIFFFYFNVKLIIKLIVNNFSFFIATHHTFFMCKFKQVYRGNHSELSTCSYQFFSQ